MQWAPDGLAWWSLACALVPTLIPRLPSLSLSLSLSAHHTLRPVTLGRWPLSGQSQTGQARPDTAAEQSNNQRPLCAKCFITPISSIPQCQPHSSAMAHFGHSQATVRKHNHQANLFWSLYTTWSAWNILYPSLHTSEDHPSHPCLIAIKTLWTV